ncbi:MAG: glycosyltransferase [Flavobacteriales bacterium]|nr:MAG: glycosyltransferase [Flavobacteriales bacterium]
MLISIVIPAYNEESNIIALYDKIDTVLIGYEYEVIFIDDGSTDNTLDVLKALCRQHSNCHYISLSRNFGHQNALKAGIDYAKGDAVAMMDADLQHPPELLIMMIEKWQEGYDIVYTQKKEDKSRNFLKREISNIVYSLINKISDIKIEPNASDYRLVDSAIAKIIKNNTESNLFIRGITSWLGFKQYKIVYNPSKRFSGTPKYTFGKLAALGLNGITSSSVRPLRFSAICGAVISFLAFLYALYAIYIKLFTNEEIVGWASVLVSVLFIGGLQLIMLGIIGEYIGKVFIQSKQRPNYIISESELD